MSAELPSPAATPAGDGQANVDPPEPTLESSDDSEANVDPPELEPAADDPVRRGPSSKAYLVILALAVCLLAGALSNQALARAERFGYGSPDDAMFVQYLWNTTQGRPFTHTLERWEPPYEVNHLGSHFDLSCLVHLPGAIVAPGYEAPMLLQPLLVLLGAFPLFFFARRRLERPGMALAVTCLYLAHPLLLSNCLRLGAYLQLAPPLLLFAIERWDRGRPRTAALLFGLAVLTREEVALAVCAFLLPLALLDAKKRRWCLLIAGGCLLWFLLYVVLLKVHVFGPGPDMISGRYQHLGDSIPAVLFSPVLRPLTVLGHLVRSEGTMVGLLVLLPALPALILAPRYLLAALVPLVGVALSAKGSDHVLGKYLIPAVPFMVAGAVVGLARFRAWTTSRRSGDMSLILLALLVALTFGAWSTDAGIFWRYRPLRCFNPRHLEALEAMTPEFRELNALLDQVPPEASVSASPLTWLHLAPRRFLHPFPIRAQEVDMIVVDTSSRPPRWPSTSNADHAARVSAALAEPGVRVTRAGDYVLIDRRKQP